MRNELRLMLDYQCDPLWLYNDQGIFIDNFIPIEIKNNKELYVLLTEIQKEFDSLYVDTPIEFKYTGFRVIRDKELFIEKVENAYKLIYDLLSDRYKVTNFVHPENL